MQKRRFHRWKTWFRLRFIHACARCYIHQCNARTCFYTSNRHTIGEGSANTPRCLWQMNVIRDSLHGKIIATTRYLERRRSLNILRTPKEVERREHRYRFLYLIREWCVEKLESQSRDTYVEHFVFLENKKCVEKRRFEPLREIKLYAKIYCREYQWWIEKFES